MKNKPKKQYWADNNLILNPVENIPLAFLRNNYDHLSGLYITDKIRTRDQKKNAKILFAGRSEMVNDVNQVYKQWCQILNADDITFRPLSGLNAHMLLFLSLGYIGDRIMLLPEKAGGHFSTRSILLRLGYDVVDIPVDVNDYSIDLEKAIAIQKNHPCKFLFVDRSEGINYEDFTELCTNFNGYKIFDASQYLTNIIFKQFKSPFDMGFDLMLSTVHKNFPGPQKALICTRDKNDQYWDIVLKAMRDCVSNIHGDKIIMLGDIVSNPKLESYSSEILENSVYLENCLKSYGVPIVEKKHTTPPTHHIWINYHNQERAYQAYTSLEKNHILVNYRLLPYDLGYGLRMGTTCATVQGINKTNIPQLAEYIATIIATNKEYSAVKEFIDNLIANTKYEY